MPFLGGLFSRKSKSSPRSKRDDPAATASMHTSELGSGLSSPTTSYVTPDNSIPSYPNARNLLPDSAHERPSSNVYPSMASMSIPPTGKKLRLPFARKKIPSPRSDLSGSSPNIHSPSFGASRPVDNPRLSTSALVSKTDPEDLRRLRPPPSRSAIFAAYSDTTNSPSTHSLPDEASVVSEPSFSLPPQLPRSSKRTSLFTWSKGTSKSSPLGDPTLHTPSTPDSENSFNLKSFRHIRAPSPTRSNASNVSLAMPVSVPRLRPRGESINSDSSQRISVAAFREVQARRSLADSPSPSFRAPSPVPTLLSPSTSSPQFQNRIQSRGRQSSMVLYTSDSDSSTSSSDGTEDETIKRRPGMSHSELNNHARKDKGKAKSEMGHRNGDCVAPQRAPRSHSGHSWQPSGETTTGTSGSESPRSRSSHSTPAPKLQATVSTTPSSSFATVKLAGTQVALTPNFDIAGSAKPSREIPLSTHSISHNTTQCVSPKYQPASESESDSEDDAPLAALVGPRRPGSSVSSYSSVHARSTGNVTIRSTRSSSLGLAKPLIDINELTGSKRSFTATEKSTAGFTQGPTLLSGTKRSMSPTSLSTGNPSDLNRPLTRKAPPVKFISPPPSPSTEAMQFIPHTVDGADSTAESDPTTLPSEKSATSEYHRDALTERLSRVVNMKVIPSSSNTIGSNISGTTSSVPSQTETPNISAGDTSHSSRQLRSEKVNFPLTKEARTQPSAESPSSASASKVDHSPSNEDLAQLLGTAGIEFMLRNDEIPDQLSESESEEEEDSFEEAKEEVTSTGNRIAPIPIKERPPASSFSVTSRPPFPGRDIVTATQRDATRLSTASSVVVSRPRSITLTPSSTSSNSLNKISVNNDVSLLVPSKSTTNIPPHKLKNDALKVPNVRQRSSTILTGAPPSAQTAKAFHVPERPFAVRRNSPASSTEGSSSGRAPLTPRDGSEIGVQDRKRHEWSGGASGLGMRKNQHLKGRSVSFEEDHLDSKPRDIPQSRGKQHANNNAAIDDEDREARRKERRRSEAKAAIELGNVVNGPAPIVDDEDEINHNISPRMSTLNPMTAMGLQIPTPMGFGSPNSVAWGGNMMQSVSPYSMPPTADPNFLAAHQHAMMYAKQAYQMAVARQAMAAAGDEWERSSSIGGYGGSSMIGASSSSTMMSPQFGMMPMGQGYGWSSPSSVYLPSSSRSMYGGAANSNSRSEYGGIGGSNNWSSSRSSYGELFGPSLDQYGRKNAQGRGHAQRDSVSSLRAPVMPAAQPQNGRGSPVRSGNGQRDSSYLPPMPALQLQTGRGPDGTPRPRTGSQPTSSSRSTFVRKTPPPSSWKAGG